MTDPASPIDDLERQLRSALNGTYEVTGELQGGGMSRVFRATDLALGRTVVIKVLPLDVAAGVNRDRFRREIQLAAQLQHPHIVPLLAAGELGGLLYYTMPFIPGESLKHAIEGRQRVSVKETVRIMRDVADALAHAHSRGIVHRDIKPGNVLRVDAHALVTDFGVAKALSASLPGVSMTTSGMAVGTPAYMAPEQIAGDPAADHRVDIYAAGLLAYELLTGSSPFASDSPQETLARQLTRDPEPLDLRRTDVPLGLAALISRCLAKAPESRPQSAAQIVAELDSLMSTSGDFLPRPAAAKKRTLPLVAAAAAIVVALGAWAAVSRPAPPVAAAPAVVPPPAPAPPPKPMSHADSIAIARAVERKLAETKPAAPRENAAAAAPAPAAPTAAYTDSLRAAIMHSVLDSVMKSQAAARQLAAAAIDAGRAARPPADSTRSVRVNPLSAEAFANRAANLGPPRRVFVSVPRELRGSAAINLAGTVIMNTLRAALARDPRYVVLPVDTVSQALAITRTTDSLATLLHVELFASITPIPTGEGALLWQLSTRDLGAVSAYSSRLTALSVPLDSMLARADSLVSMSVKRLAEMDKAPRKAPH